MNHFLIRLCCSMRTEFYVTTRDDQLSGWSKRKLQSISESQNCTKKNKDHGHCLLICCPSDPLQLSESRWNHYIWEVCSSTSMRCTENCNACRLHWSTERAQFSIILADHTLHNQCLKNWMNWVTMFCLIHHIHLTSHQPTTISSSILTTFCRENASTTSRRQKMLSESSSNPKAWVLFNRNKQTDFSLAKMCWEQWFLFWLIKICLNLIIMI